MLFKLLIIFNLTIIDYLVIKCLKWLKNAVKINDRISALDLEDDFWED